MNTPHSTLGRLLNEISWEGNARKYRHGGPGLENVLTAEVFQALDFLPRTEFLGRIIRSAECGSRAALEITAQEVEDLTLNLLQGDIYLAEDPPAGKGRLHLQPDGIFESSRVYCMLEAKRIKPGAFQPEQLAREFLAVMKMAKGRTGLLFLVLPEAPPIRVSRHGRLGLREAVQRWLPQVLARAEGEFPPFDELCLKIDPLIAFTTWRRISEEIDGALQDFSSPDPSVRASIRRLATAVLHAIRRHGLSDAPDPHLKLSI